MNNVEQSLVQSIDKLVEKFIKSVKDKMGVLPLIEADSDWPSPCEVSVVNEEGLVQWQPSKIQEPLNFKNVGDALNITIHPDIEQYFCYLYSESIPAKSSHGHLELLFAWNKDDFDRLQQNLIGHMMMKQKLKQEITLFFAVTDEEDMNLVVKNSTGEVWVEPVGCEPKTMISASLAEFLDSLSFE